MSSPRSTNATSVPIPIRSKSASSGSGATRISSHTPFCGSAPSSSLVNPFTPDDFVFPQFPTVECPPAFLPPVPHRSESQIQLDVFHHPAELRTPENEELDPLSATTDAMAASTESFDPGRIDTTGG